MNLENKVVVVIGASGGIGRQISREFAKEKVRLVLVGRNKFVLEPLRKEIEKKGGSAFVVSCDITNKSSVKSLESLVRDKYGVVDVLVNAAGIGVYKKFSEVTYDEWRKQMAINVDGVFLVIKTLLPLLEKSKKAYVISLGSGMGKIAVAKRSPYCASKFALRGLIKSLSKEYKNTNINFVLLTLGSVLTSFGPLSIDDKLKKVKKGKKYLDPEWLASHIVVKLKHETFDPETPIYPQKYFKESKKGKT